MANAVGIIGVGQTPYVGRREDCILPDLVREAVVAALKDADVTPADIEAGIFSLAPDALEGVDAAEKWCASGCATFGKPFMRVNTGGATGGSAAQAGFFNVASGLADVAIVAGGEKMGETPDAQKVLNQIWDPFFEREAALNAINMCSLQAVRHMHKYRTTEEHMALVAVRTRNNGLRNPLSHIKRKVTVKDVLDSRQICWPIKIYDACPRSTGACAIVLASEPWIRKAGRKAAWIRGVGACTDSYFMGDRMSGSLHDHADWDGLQQAAQHAYRMAGIANPSKEIDLAEIYAPFSCTELAAVEALGFCAKGESGKENKRGRFNPEGPLPINLSGGVLCANPISVTALVRVAEAALQILHRAGDRQADRARNAVATGIGGSLQFHTATFLSAASA